MNQTQLSLLCTDAGVSSCYKLLRVLGKYLMTERSKASIRKRKQIRLLVFSVLGKKISFLQILKNCSVETDHLMLFSHGQTKLLTIELSLVAEVAAA